MKGKISNLRLLMAAIVATIGIAAGCSRFDEPVRISETIPVTFRSSLPATRTTAGGNNWVQGDAVGVFMTGVGGTIPADIITAGGTVGCNAKYTATPKSDAAYATLEAATDGDRLCYPGSGKVDFTAYYPWRETPDTNPYRLSLSLTNQAAPETDVLWGKVSNVEKSDDAVPITLTHRLSKMVLNLKAGDGVTTDDLVGAVIDLYDMPTTAQLDLTDGSIVSGSMGNIAYITPLAATTPEGVALSSHAIVFPQSYTDGLDRAAVYITLSDDIVYEWRIPPIAAGYVAGKSYTYGLVVSMTGISLEGMTIADWLVNEDENTEMMRFVGIYTASDLKAFADAWNMASATADAGARQLAQNAVITEWSADGTATGTVHVWCDIDMSDVDDYIPIGRYEGGSGTIENYEFAGKFDGGGFTISGLTVDVAGGYVGLFGRIGSTGDVSNVVISDCDFMSDGSSVGSVAGYNRGTISDSQVTSGNMIASSSSGGIAGTNLGTICDCEMSGSHVESQGSFSGGIVGYNTSAAAMITGCTVTGGDMTASQHSGGIVGQNNNQATIFDCRMTNSTVEGRETSTSGNAGGIAGYNNGGRLIACLMAGGDVIANAYYAGGIVGSNKGAVVACATMSGHVTAKWYAGGIVGENNNTNAKVVGCWSTATKLEATSGNYYVGGIAGRNVSSATIIASGWTTVTTNAAVAVGSGGTVGAAGSEFSTATIAEIHTQSNAVLMNASIAALDLADAMYWKIEDGVLTLTATNPGYVNP